MLAAAIIVAGYAERARLPLKIRSVNVRVPPKAASTPAPKPRIVRGFSADAWWAFSALPECFVQERESKGPRAYVIRHLSGAWLRVPPGTDISTQDCSVFVRDGEVGINRGADRLRIPPPATLYQHGRSFALLERVSGVWELRTYETLGPVQEKQ